MKNKNLKESKGITLIALVITIIVLLILAAVSIATLTGENGILTKAQTAKKETEEGQEEEQVRLAQAEANMNDKETEYAGITIPAGMAPTRAEGESTVDEGLVAVDKNGNEWVWIEVPISEIMKGQELTFTSEEDENYNTLKEALEEYADPYTTAKVTINNESVDYVGKDEWYAVTAENKYPSASNVSEDQKKLDTGCGLNYNQYEEIYHAMLKSIYENEGFWIGRYEAGIEGTTGTDEASLALGRTEGNKEINKKAICQKDAIPYNYITCSESEKLAEAMSPDSSKTSSLLFGIQWNLVCKFIEEKEVARQGLNKREEIIKSINENSEEWGNYNKTHIDNLSSNAKGYSNGKWNTITTKLSYEENDSKNTLLSTGASEKNKKLNIYDFAGNIGEWTLEHATNKTDNPCAWRSGCFSYNPQPASCHGMHGTTNNNVIYSFRPALY